MSVIAFSSEYVPPVAPTRSRVFKTDFLPCGGKPINDPKNPTVVEIGQFAVNEENARKKSNLQFQSVIKGEIQLDSCVKYKLVIAAKDGRASNQYEAIVCDKPWENFRKLASFEKL